MLVTSPAGGRWRFRLDLEAAPPDPVMEFRVWGLGFVGFDLEAVPPDPISGFRIQSFGMRVQGSVLEAY